MLDAEDLSSLVPVPPKDGSRRRRAAPRKSDLRRVPLTGSSSAAKKASSAAMKASSAAHVLTADDAFGHLSSLAAGMSPRTVDGLIKAVRKEAADYVVARQAERSAELKAEREAAAKARRGSLSPEAPRRGSLMARRSSVASRLADAGAAPAPAPEPAPSDTPSGRVSPAQPDGLSPGSSSSYTLKAGARPARDHAQQLEEAQRAAAAERLAQCRRLAALPSAPTPDDFVTLGQHYSQLGEHDRAAATFFQVRVGVRVRVRVRVGVGVGVGVWVRGRGRGRGGVGLVQPYY